MDWRGFFRSRKEKSAGILCVFRAFLTGAGAEKGRQDIAHQLCKRSIYINTIAGGRGYLNVLAAYSFTGRAELKAFQRRDDEHLHILLPQPHGYKLQPRWSHPP